ncbi:GGDEF domain-containing protein [Vibrio sp. JC009]|uniref:sensor domain-containing diguanylate cyclase n=1 Tax=Vibrio sp. JC009 TaxID=2912314 RepID=UPI0023AFE09C|nr:sensor domain-containing diguanylate cyclase [Vibrio sp. JC009]WED23383.1 GGDEF domain-containing protein [Vibrio sp. JC009]
MSGFMSDESPDLSYESSIHAGKMSILEHFWQHSDDNIFIMVLDEDDEFSIEDLNPAQIRNFEMGNEYKGKKLKELLDDAIHASVDFRYRKCLAENIPHTYDETFLLHGKTRHWNTMIIPVLNSADGKTRIFGIAREMTPLIKAKEALATINEGLEKVISERTIELQESNSKLMEQSRKLEEQALKDPLTQIGNRRYFFNHVESYLQAAKDKNQPVSIIYTDLDNFKQVNDSYGHLVGDSILKEFTERINSQLTDSDIFARFGGEEFVIFLPEVDTEAARKKAAEILQSVSSSPFIVNDKSVKVTSSIGLAVTIPDENFILDKLLSNADKALYSAKRNGKNCVEVYER